MRSDAKVLKKTNKCITNRVTGRVSCIITFVISALLLVFASVLFRVLLLRISN